MKQFALIFGAIKKTPICVIDKIGIFSYYLLFPCKFKIAFLDYVFSGCIRIGKNR